MKTSQVNTRTELGTPVLLNEDVALVSLMPLQGQVLVLEDWEIGTISQPYFAVVTKAGGFSYVVNPDYLRVPSEEELDEIIKEAKKAQRKEAKQARLSAVKRDKNGFLIVPEGLTGSELRQWMRKAKRQKA